MTGRKKKIILAEDNLAIVDALTIMLEEFLLSFQQTEM